jgi:16S rRNA (guanine966-N2)-methyltransferase
MALVQEETMSRIIAGTAKGGAIRTSRGLAIRPTASRVREAVFNTLSNWAGSATVATAQQLEGISFLDLYAGSGAVGLEAASRGASPVTLVERDGTTAALIRSNAAALKLDVKVVANQVAQYLSNGQAPFDIIFLDPPYDVPNDEITRCLVAIMRNDWLTDDGIVIVERSRRTPAFTWPSELERNQLKAYGETVIYYGDRGTNPMLGENQEQYGLNEQNEPQNVKDADVWN